MPAKPESKNKKNSNPPDEVWELRLYVAGHTPKSIKAFDNLKKICDEHLKGKYHIEVIDLLKNPQLAKGDQIVAVPTLVRKLPEPIKKIIGDLSNTLRVLVGLDLRPKTRGNGVISNQAAGEPMKNTKAKDSTAEFEKKLKERGKEKYLLRLYVAGMTTKSKQAIQSVKQICEEHLKDRCELEVIDVFRNPVLAKGEQIIATPTLLKKLPLPLRRFIGDMSATERILVGLDLRPKK